jgi:hypothetical protein
MFGTPLGDYAVVGLLFTRDDVGVFEFVYATVKILHGAVEVFAARAGVNFML